MLTLFNKTPDGVYPCAACAHCKASLWARLTNNTDKFMCTFTYTVAREQYHPVTGEKIKRAYPLCRTSRSEYSDQSGCGPKAAHWEPKNKKDLFKLIKKEQ